jgi:hypothetical protein
MLAAGCFGGAPSAIDAFVRLCTTGPLPARIVELLHVGKISSDTTPYTIL